MKQLFLLQVQQSETRFAYRVNRVVNSTDPKVGEMLKEEVANSYCENDDWKVDIKT